MSGNDSAQPTVEQRKVFPRRNTRDPSLVAFGTRRRSVPLCCASRSLDLHGSVNFKLIFDSCLSPLKQGPKKREMTHEAKNSKCANTKEGQSDTF